MSPSATNEINDQKIVSDISLPDEIPESAQTAAARVPGDQLFSLKNQTVLITGAGRGLGIELALGVVENGGHVAALDILETPSEEEWTHLQKTAKQRGVTASYRKADITDEEDFKAAVAEISSRGRELGAPLQGAFACAGIQQKIPTLEYPVADFERMLRVNTVGMFLVPVFSSHQSVRRYSYIIHSRFLHHSQGSGKRHGGEQDPRKHRPHCIHVRQHSQQGKSSNQPNQHPQSQNPTCILTHPTGPNLQRLQHKQSRRAPAMQIHGARDRPARNPNQHPVSWREPSPALLHFLQHRLTEHQKYIRTAMTDALLAAEPEVEKTWMAGALLGRLGAPEDFKAPAVFLLSRGSSFMTGTDLRVDGGHTAAV
jgi:NAD(P)-dependent dehydrogenase (short-subunit alcohol dehydrogenase family)